MLFFGFGVAVGGLVVLPRRIRRVTPVEERTQAHLLISVLLVAAFVVVLANITLLSSIGWIGLTLVEPTAQPGNGRPIALLFGCSRPACVAIAAVLALTGQGASLSPAMNVICRRCIMSIGRGMGQGVGVGDR
ncbi:hypothetical protein GCM10009609_37470 [Pseudonocardia aurantiaca]|uniref:Uncharacterized protein n=1 Tax=Pseudonocardia aurantiaca TaxID=75290 RepID=A0ABW4FMM2_9PSEU